MSAALRPFRRLEGRPKPKTGHGVTAKLQLSKEIRRTLAVGCG